MKRRVLDVSDLGTFAFGARDPLWWGMVLLSVIEGMLLALLALCYAYVRERTTPWPPTPVPPWLGWLATLELAIMLLSIPPMIAASRAAIRGDVRGMRNMLIACTVLALAAGACRFAIFEYLPFRWDTHAYGSVVWALLVTQSLHGLTGIAENLLFIVLLYVGPVEDKHRVDVEVSTILWWFVIAGQALVYLVVWLEVLL